MMIGAFSLRSFLRRRAQICSRISGLILWATITTGCIEPCEESEIVWKNLSTHQGKQTETKPTLIYIDSLGFGDRRAQYIDKMMRHNKKTANLIGCRFQNWSLSIQDFAKDFSYVGKVLTLGAFSKNILGVKHEAILSKEDYHGTKSSPNPKTSLGHYLEGELGVSVKLRYKAKTGVEINPPGTIVIMDSTRSMRIDTMTLFRAGEHPSSFFNRLGRLRDH